MAQTLKSDIGLGQLEQESDGGKNHHNDPDLDAFNIGALIIRIGLWGPLYYNSNKEPPK